MRTAIQPSPRSIHASKARKPVPHPSRTLFLAASMAMTLCAAGPLLASQQASTQVTSHKPVHPHKRPAATHPASAPQTPPEPVAPPAPKPPDWPVNDHPSEATVVWNSQGLRIEASNSSLGQIMKDISSSTGVKIQGLGSDQRIFGNYGPGNARDVLAQLLDGSGYNVLMIGDQGEGTPREILLSKQTKGGASPAGAGDTPVAAPNDDNSDAEEQPDQQPQPPQQTQPPEIRNGFTPGAPPRTPQQIMQEMQQRQQQQLQNSPQ